MYLLYIYYFSFESNVSHSEYTIYVIKLNKRDVSINYFIVYTCAVIVICGIKYIKQYIEIIK